jgi:O-antigen ligase
LLTQIGLVGPLLFLAILIAHYLSIYRLTEPERLASAALFAVFAFGNLFNSFLLDSAERTLYMILVSGFLAAANHQASDS